MYGFGKIFKNLKAFIANKKGITSIEFAILFLPFFIILIVLIETMLLSYKVAMIDYIVNAGAKYSSSFSKNKNYEEKFKDFIKTYKDYFLDFANNDDLKIKLSYCKNLDDLANNSCTNSKDKHKIILYSFEYKIKPLFVNLRLINQDEFIKRQAVYFTEKAENEN